MPDGKVFFHVDLDAFFASVEQRDNPQYRGKPLIVGRVGKRMVVSTCSYEARKYGVHSAMPTLTAQKLCPNGIFVDGDYRKYSRVSHQVMTVLKEYSPEIHQVSIDEAYMDMTGTKRLFGEPRQLAALIKERVKKEIGITLSIGIATNPFIAKMASDYNKPDGLCAVSPGKEEVFIDAIGLEKLWGLGKSGIARVKSKGFFTASQVRSCSPEYLKMLFGDNMGNYLFNAVRGIDPGFMRTEAKSHSISSETTFTDDVADEETLKQVLMSMSNELIARSLDEKIMGKTVGLKLRWGDFHTITVQITPEDSILNSSQLFNFAVCLLKSKWQPGQGIRLIGLGLYQTYSGDCPIQDNLFSQTEHRKRDLDKTIHSLELKGLKLKKASQMRTTDKF